MCTLLPWPVGGRGGGGRERGEEGREVKEGGREGEITDQPQPSNL